MYTVPKGILGEIDRLGASTREDYDMTAGAVRVVIIQVHGQRLSGLIADDLQVYQSEDAATRRTIGRVVWRNLGR